MFSTRSGWNLNANPLADRLRRRKTVPLDLTVSNPTRCGFAYDQPRILKALAQPASLSYEPNAVGLFSAREAVATYYRERGVRVEPDKILLTASSSEAYSHLFRLLCNSGDRVHFPQPSYPLFELLAEINDVTLAPYSLFYDHGWHLDAESLRRAVDERSRAIVAVNPNNPTGSYVNGNDWRALQQLAAERGLAVIVDEVFSDYLLNPAAERVRDFTRDAQALTFVLNGLSKISALPQMKLGWMVVVGPEEGVSAALERLEVITDTYLSVDTPIQHAASELLGTRKAIQPQIIDRLRSNLTAADRHLGGCVRRLQVDGGWYVIFQLPCSRTDEEWAGLLLDDADVYIHPGHFYDFSSDGYLVASLIVEEATFVTAVERLVRTVNENSR